MGSSLAWLEKSRKRQSVIAGERVRANFEVGHSLGRSVGRSVVAWNFGAGRRWCGRNDRSCGWADVICVSGM